MKVSPVVVIVVNYGLFVAKEMCCSFVAHVFGGNGGIVIGGVVGVPSGFGDYGGSVDIFDVVECVISISNFSSSSASRFRLAISLLLTSLTSYL